MRVKHIKYGPFVNQSEEIALEYIRAKLINQSDTGDWVLLSNIPISPGNDYRPPLELDILAIGSTGVKVIEVKHWDRDFVEKKSNSEVLHHEVVKLNDKVKILATRFRKAGFHEMGFYVGKILLTRNPKEKYEGKNGRKKIESIEFYSLSEWRELLNCDSKKILDSAKIKNICKTVFPRTNISIDESIRQFENFIELKPLIQNNDPLCRIYRAKRKLTRDNIILYLYDLSKLNTKDNIKIARRESEVMRLKSKANYLPSIWDSFQEAANYPGEIYYFTITDPEAVSINEKVKDNDWSLRMRLDFAIKCINALNDLHESGDKKILHRNITPDNIWIRSDNTPLLMHLRVAKIQDEFTISDAIAPEFHGIEDFVAPEIRRLGLKEAKQESDIYSLASSLCVIFDGMDDSIADKVRSILVDGMDEDPTKRLTLPELKSGLTDIFNEIKPGEEISDESIKVEYWDEKLKPRKLGDRFYKILSKLGTGGMGTTFKVMEVNESGEEEKSGPYVAKAITNENFGEEASKSYAKVRAQTGGQYLAQVLEVRNQWQKNEITALLNWIEGDSLHDWKGQLLEYIDEINEGTRDDILLKWICELCEGLAQLHNAGLIHGDVTPKNIIIKGENLTLTDFDLSTKSNSKARGGTRKYCSKSVDNRAEIDYSDDIFALAASFFHVCFDSCPFDFDGNVIKNKGLNWNNVVNDNLPLFIKFLDKATHPKRTERFSSAEDVRSTLNKWKEESSGESIDDKDTTEVKILTDNKVPWLSQILQSYPASPKGNIETRGLDSDFSRQTYVDTELDEHLWDNLTDGKFGLIILCGNAGDGKTAVLQNLARNLDLKNISSSDRIWDKTIDNGIQLVVNLDGAASFKGRSATELLDEIFAPFMNGDFPENLVHCLAINDGPLLSWIEDNEGCWLTEQLYSTLTREEGFEIDQRISFIDLNERSLVGGFPHNSKEMSYDFLDKLLNKTIGDSEYWKPCETCTAQNRCQAWRSVRSLDDKKPLGKQIRKRFYAALQAVHQRGEIHITARTLRGLVAYVFFGTHDCDDLHNMPELFPEHYWNRTFSASSEYRQGELLDELIYLDPSLEFHPRVDRFLLNQEKDRFPDDTRNPDDENLSSLRRRAYFEWDLDKIRSVAGSDDALILRHCKHQSKFLEAANCTDDRITELCNDLCEGIARLEDLPEQAFDEDKNYIPLKITPRTPIETSLWVKKAKDRFSLKPAPFHQTESFVTLHTHVILSYQFSDDHSENLIIGADLFHLLMELKDGYQMSDIRSDDIFANLSVFKQRLAQEEEHSIYAWNPMSESIYTIKAQLIEEKQRITIQQSEKEVEDE